MTSTLLVAPHPDDEVLGGSAVLAHAAVTVVHVTDGVPPWVGPEEESPLRSLRHAECSRAWKALSADVECIQLGYQDLRAWASVREISDALYRLVEHVEADRVFLPAYQRGHPDHDATYLAGALASDRLRGRATEWVVYGLYGLDQAGKLRFGWLPTETYASVEARADRPLIDAKQQALRAFSSQLRPESVVQQWLDDPSAEQFAPLPLDWRHVPHVPCFYDQVLRFDRYGAGSAVVESSFRAALVQAVA